MALWFTADTHFGHANVIRYCDRPFATVDEMDDALIGRWCAVVGATDEVWHLGDFAFGDPGPYLRRLSGRVHLIRGNHDHRRTAQLAAAGFASIADVHQLHWEGVRIWLSHYAHRVWPNSHHGAWHLYGHSHGTLPGSGRSLDVGVDCWDYAPVSFEALRDRLAGLPAAVSS